MISTTSILSLLVLASTVCAAPMHRAEYSFIPRVAITVHSEEDDTPLKVISLRMAGGDFLDGGSRGHNTIRYVHLTEGIPVDIEMTVRVVKDFSTKHVTVTYHLMTADGELFQEASTDYIHTFDTVCKEGGVGHEFTCEKGSGIKNLKLKLPNEWPNADNFKSKDLMLTITIESAEKDVLSSTWIYAKLH